MRDAAGAGPRINLFDRQRRGLDLLVGIPGGRRDEPALLDKHEVAAVVQKGRVRMHTGEQTSAFAGVARFLEQLAHAGGDGVLARVDHTAGNLPRKRVDAVTELVHQH